MNTTKRTALAQRPDLHGRVALITGGARGLGASTAQELARQGADIVITDILDVAGQAVVDDLMSKWGVKATYCHHDVTDEAGWKTLIKFCCAEHGGVDILVNNAGITLVRPLLETTLAEFRSVQQVNVEGCFLGMKAAIPTIASRADRWEGGGAIINMSSIAGIVGSRGAIAYNASKAAVRLMTKSVALECSALNMNIRVNSVHPGRIATEMLAEANAGFEHIPRHGAPTMTGQPCDISGIVAFLASDAARFITGAEIVADGGFTAQ